MTINNQHEEDHIEEFVPLSGLFNRWSGTRVEYSAQQRLMLRKHARIEERHDLNPSRVQLLGDAFFAIVATICYLPLMNSLNNPELDVSQLALAFAVAVYCFEAIAAVGSVHSRVCFWLAAETPVTTAMHFTVFFLTSLLPFFGVLMVDSTSHFPLFIFCGVISLLCLLFLLFFHYLTALRPDLSRCPWDRPKVLLFYARLSLWLVGNLLAACFTWLFAVPVWSLLFLLVSPIANSLVLPRCFPAGQHLASRAAFSRSFCNTERFVCFSDAVFAFGATLILADLRVELSEIPLLQSGLSGFVTVMDAKAPQIAAFAWALLFVGCTWVVHHGLVQCIAAVKASFFVTNAFLLAVIPSISFGAKWALITIFPAEEPTDEIMNNNYNNNNNNEYQNALMMRMNNATHEENGNSSSNIHNNLIAPIFFLSLIHFYTIISLFILFVTILKNPHYWSPLAPRAFLSKIWLAECAIYGAVSMLLSILAMSLAFTAPFASLGLLLFHLAFSLFWFTFSSYLAPFYLPPQCHADLPSREPLSLPVIGLDSEPFPDALVSSSVDTTSEETPLIKTL